ncbi:MAG: nuclear transport factor 2 family protein [Christiangramia sp.]|nr:hypothetical protein [Christiangramia sp.]
MNFFKMIPLVALTFFISCNEAHEEADDVDDMKAEEANMQKPEDASKDWIAAWNNNDPASLDSLTGPGASLYMQGKQVDSDSISSWYQVAAPQMENLETQSTASYSGKDVAYEAGSYQHQLKGDSLDMTYRGAYTIIWKRQGDNWKIDVMNIADDMSSDSTRVPENADYN